MKKKYPKELFFFGIVSNIIQKFYLWIPGLFLLLIGVWSRTCRILGLLLLAAAVIYAVYMQIVIKRTFEMESDNPNFKPFQDAVMGGGNWMENVIKMVEEDSESFEPDDETKR